MSLLMIKNGSLLRINLKQDQEYSEILLFNNLRCLHNS